MATTGVKAGVFDTLKVRDPTSNQLVDVLAAGTAVTALEARIAALEALSVQIESGTITQASTISGLQSHTVTFSQTFSSVPRVFTNQNTGNSSGHLSIVRIYSINTTQTGCTIVVDETEQSGSYSLAWMAVL